MKNEIIQFTTLFVAGFCKYKEKNDENTYQVDFTN